MRSSHVHLPSTVYNTHWHGLQTVHACFSPAFDIPSSRTPAASSSTIQAFFYNRLPFFIWNPQPDPLSSRAPQSCAILVPTVCHQASMCSRHLPPCQPLTTNQQLPPDFDNISTLRTLSNAQHVLCGGVAEFGVSSNLTAHAISRRGWSHGRRGTSLNYDVANDPRRGGSPSEEPGTLRFRNCASARHRHNACPVEPRWWRYHAASARRTVRHPRVALFLLRLRLLFLIRLLRPRPAPP